MDLTTHYLGLALRNPLVASSSPLTAELAGIRRLEDAGVGAVVLPSLFEEQIDAETRHYDRLMTVTSNFNAEGESYFPHLDDYRVGPDAYLRLIEDAKKAVGVPVIASLNGTSGEGWVHYARLMAEAGADALELNIYFIPTDLSLSGRDVEQRYIDIVQAVRKAVQIPIAVKLSPYFSSFGNLALQLDAAKVDGLVLFNRFYQPDIDLEGIEVLTDLKLSTPNEIRLPLLWLGVLYGKVNAALAATTGVASGHEVAKYLLAGADAVMATSALLRHGPAYAGVILDGLKDWLAKQELDSVEAVKGSLSQARAGNPKAFERANYIKILQGYGGAEHYNAL